MDTQRISRIQSPVIPIVGQLIANHPGTISLGQGVVHYAPPEAIKSAVIQAIANDPRVHRYGMFYGIPEFIQQVASKLEAENRIRVDERHRIICTAGSNMGFLNAAYAIADPGDEIILLSPCYFNHEMAITMADCRSVLVPTTDEYQIDFGRLKAAITARTKAIVTVSPSNPTGAIYPAADIVAVNRLCEDHGIFHISDEAYEYFVYDGQQPFSPASLDNAVEHTISLYSLSKAYGMAGWRVGYMLVPKRLEVAIKKVQDTNLVCPPIINQFAGICAMQAGRDWCRQQIEPFSEVRDTVLDMLSTLGSRCHVPKPAGAFYVLMRVETQTPDMELVEELIKRFGVAVIPGSTFGIQDGCYLRLSYGALEAQSVVAGMQRLVAGLSQLI